MIRESRLFELCEKNKITLGAGEAGRLCDFADILYTENEKYNLTATTDEDGIILRHFIDSMTVLPYIEGERMLDVGSGAGFPAVPAAIMKPSLSVTPLDSTGKRMNFVKAAAESLGLSNVQPITARAEEAAHDSRFRESFDTVVSRAVAKMSVLVEITIPFVKVGGVVIAMKGEEDVATAELDEAAGAISALGAEVERIVPIELFGGDGEALHRTLIIMRKKKRTDGRFPRRYARILKERI